MCVELTALLKHWLDGRGYNTQAVSHTLRVAGDRPGYHHAMVAVPQGGNMLLIDPTNMIKVRGDVFPDFMPMRDGFTAVPQLYIVRSGDWNKLLVQGKERAAMIELDNASVWLRPEPREKAYFGFAFTAETLEVEKLLISAKNSSVSGPGAPQP